MKADPNAKRPRATDLGNGILITHEDERLWGRRFTFQNHRPLYWPMLASGDFDLMTPFFDYYQDVLPTRRAITHAWFWHEEPWSAEQSKMAN